MRHSILALFLLYSLNTLAQGSLEGDRLALVAFYHSAGGSVWYNHTGWVVPGSPGGNPCGWFGVTCTNGRVTKLSLPDNEFFGNIPPEIGNLTALNYLDLSGPGREFGNLLSGSIPVELGALSNLEHLNLLGNDFNGDHIKVIGNLVKLKYLAITPDWNIPCEFGNLVNLEYLNLSVLDQSGLGPQGKAGNLPVSIGNLTRLKTFVMNKAGATGAIPAALGSLTNLEILDFQDNSLTGSIPVQFVNLKHLQKLNLSFNQLSGNIPSLSGIPAAATVDISNNGFNFDGLEANIPALDSYAPQSVIPLTIVPAFPLPYIISMDVGGLGADSKNRNTYKFFKDGVLIATQAGDARLFIKGGGNFKIEATNSMVPGLTLYSTEVFIDLGPMPVTLVSFSGENKKSGNTLTWKTAAETSNYGFEIEKSVDAKTFEKIGFIDGNGNSKETNVYRFTDPNPLSRTYYRLKQLDYDGKYEYSRVISVITETPTVTVYPNPANDRFYVEGLNQKENIAIQDLQGKLISTKRISPNEPVNTSNLSNGLYLITIGNETHKMVIQK